MPPPEDIVQAVPHLPQMNILAGPGYRIYEAHSVVHRWGSYIKWTSYVIIVLSLLTIFFQVLEMLGLGKNDVIEIESKEGIF
jgi:hypothetical protein